MQQEKDSRDMSVISRESNQLPADIDDFHNGLRILARMIARAYIKDRDLEHQQLKEKQANAEPTSSKANLIRKFPKRRLALTVPETAVLLGIDRASVYDGVISGQIPSVMIGQEIVIPKAALVKLLSISLKDDKKKGIWENEYVKEDGIWKIKTILWNEIISSPLEEGWVKKPVILNPLPKEPRPLAPNSRFAPYPSGYIFPYHYKNPVTGK